MRSMNPVFIRGIRSRMRGLRAPLIISIFLFIIGGLFSLIYLLTSNTSIGYGINRPASIGAELAPYFFTLLTFTLFAVLVLMVPSMNAGAISGEREKQTLDLLLCTQLSAWRIIMGKLLSNIMFVIFLLLLTLPIFSIIYLFGSIQIMNILLVFLYMLVCAYVCASMAIFFSSLFKKTSIATILTYVALLLYVILTLVIGSMQYIEFYNTAIYPAADSYFPFMWNINPIFSLVTLSMNASSSSSSLTYSGGYGGILSSLFIRSPIHDFKPVLYSSVTMLVVSILLNIGSALCIKPVKKLQLTK